MIDPSYCPESLVIDEHEVSEKHNTILQENSRDYKSFDVGNSSTEFAEDQTEATPFNEIVQPEKLVSSTSATSDEEESENFPVTTLLSTKLSNYHASTLPPAITTMRPMFNSRTNANLYKNYSTSYAPSWRKRYQMDLQYSPSTAYSQSTDYHTSPGPTSMILMRDKWRNKSGCFYSCIQHSKGLQTVMSKYDFSSSIRLCEPSNIVRVEKYLNYSLDF